MKRNKKSFNWNSTKQRFSLRKFSFGLGSALLGTLVVPVAQEAVFPASTVAYAAEVPVSSGQEFIGEWNKQGNKEIKLETGYIDAIRVEDVKPNTALTNTTPTTLNGNNQDITLRGISVDNKSDLTLKDVGLNVNSDKPEALTSSGTLTLENVTTKGNKLDLNVTNGTATVKSAGEGTVFNTANVTGGATLNLEGSRIGIPVVKADDASKVVSSSERVNEYQGGNVTLKNLTGQLTTTAVKNLTLEGTSNVTLLANSTITDKLDVPDGTTLNIGDNQLTVKELSGTGTITLSPAGKLTIGTLTDSINIKVTHPTQAWGTAPDKEYVVVTTPKATPNVTADNTPAGKKLEKVDNAWKLVEDKALNKLELEDLITQATNPALATAVEEAKNVLANAKTQDEINAAADKLFDAIAAAMNGTLPPAVEKGSVTVSYVDYRDGTDIIPTADVVRDVPVGTEYTTTAPKYMDQKGNPLKDSKAAADLVWKGNPVWARVEVDTDDEPTGKVTAGEKNVKYGYTLVEWGNAFSVLYSESYNVIIKYVDETGKEIANQDSGTYTLRDVFDTNGASEVGLAPAGWDIEFEKSITDIDSSYESIQGQYYDRNAFQSNIDETDKKKETITTKDGQVYEFVRVKENKLVDTLTEDQARNNHTIVLEYRLKPVVEKGSVTVSYVNYKNGAEIIPTADVVRDVEAGTDYTTTAPKYMDQKGNPIDVSKAAEILWGGTPVWARVEVDTDDEPTGKVTAGEKNVKYGYALVEWGAAFAALYPDTYSVIVKYVDEAGKEIADPSDDKSYPLPGIFVESGEPITVDGWDIEFEESITNLDRSYESYIRDNWLGSDDFDGRIDISEAKKDTITTQDGQVYEFVREKENKLVDELSLDVAQNHRFGFTPYPIVLEYRLKPTPTSSVPTVDIPTVDVPAGNISVPNLPGQVPPTVELPEGKLPEVSTTVPNEGVPFPTVDVPAGNISVPNLPGQVPPTADKPELEIPAENNVPSAPIVPTEPATRDNTTGSVTNETSQSVSGQSEKSETLPKTGSDNSSTLALGLGMIAVSLGLTGKRYKKKNR